MDSSLSNPIFHNITVLNRYKACIGLRPTEHSVHLLIKQSYDSGEAHSCSLLKGEVKGLLPSLFSSNPSVDQLSIAVGRVLKADAQSMNQFLIGETISKQIPINHPAVLHLPADNPRVGDYRKMRMLSGDLVRPILLTEPDMDYLFPFQLLGVKWLLENPRGILADDMGLGKTVQAISALRILFNSGMIETVLIITPKSLLANWEDELAKWAPELTCLRVIPDANERENVWKLLLGKIHIILSNYEQMRSPVKVLCQHNWDLIIADEAHRIRNIGAMVARGIRLLKQDRYWMLTGTPIERDSTDLATLLSTIEPNRFSIKDKSLHPASLRAQARPYILRRLKKDVLTELPEVVESKETIEMLRNQTKAYQSTLRKLNTRDEDAILSVISELRTICDYDPSTSESAKADRIIEIIENIRISGEKVLVFSHLLQPLDILGSKGAKLFGPEAFIDLRGAMNAQERESAIRRFKTKAGSTALLCSTRVGGEGLTLTEANHVIFFNEWWNPSVNTQAQDRVIRIGQKRSVRIYKFKCRGTIEEALENILKSKTDTIYTLIDKLAEPSGSVQDLKPLINSLKQYLIGNQ